MHCPHCHKPLTAQVHLFTAREPAAAGIDQASTYTPPPSEIPPPPPPRQDPAVSFPEIEGWTEYEDGSPGPPKIGGVVLTGAVASLWGLILTTDIASVGYTGTAAGLREYLLDHCEHADRRDIPSVPWMPNILDQLAEQLQGRVRRNVDAHQLTYTITPRTNR